MNPNTFTVAFGCPSPRLASTYAEFMQSALQDPGSPAYTLQVRKATIIVVTEEPTVFLTTLFRLTLGAECFRWINVAKDTPDN